ncbi:MAG: hypothetical protein Q9183_003240 [Haloplaca sp. 2 TL-2023]
MEPRQSDAYQIPQQPIFGNPGSVLTPNNVPQTAAPQQAPNLASSNTWDTAVSSATAFSKVTMEEADNDPRRYRGYPALCTWMASDDDFFIIRRFGKASARIILLMQHEIAQLEEALYTEDAKCLDEDGDNGTFDGDPRQRRRGLIEELARRLERYQRFVLDHSALKARQKASDSQISYVKNWFKNNEQPIRPAETSSIEKEGDLIPLVPRLDQSHYNHRDNWVSETTIYSEEEKMDKMVTCITIGLGLAMLIAPLWLLQYVYTAEPNLETRLGVITGFLVAFALLLSVVVVARPFEVLAATAAYGAVMMVFMQLGPPGGSAIVPR